MADVWDGERALPKKIHTRFRFCDQVLLNFRVSRGRAATFRTSTDVNLTVVDSASAAVAVPSPFSTYGALIVTAGTSATAGQSGGGDGGGKANNGERRNQTETATAPSGVHGEWSPTPTVGRGYSELRTTIDYHARLANSFSICVSFCSYVVAST